MHSGLMHVKCYVYMAQIPTLLPFADYSKERISFPLEISIYIFLSKQHLSEGKDTKKERKQISHVGRVSRSERKMKGKLVVKMMKF